MSKFKYDLIDNRKGGLHLFKFDKRNMKPLNLYSFSGLRVVNEDFHLDNELGCGGLGIVCMVNVSFVFTMRSNL